MIANDLAVRGSIGDLAQHSNQPIATVFMNVTHVIIVDCSGSMAAQDAQHGEKSRYDAACTELRKLQSKYQGNFAVFGFSDETEFFPGGLPRMMGGGTDLTGALEYVEDLDGTDITIDLISDGYPDDPFSAIKRVERWSTKINTIYIGPASATDAIDFMHRLAQMSGGKSAVNDASDIAPAISGLLTERTR